MGIMPSIFLLFEKTAPMLSMSLMIASECCLPLPEKISSTLSYSEIMDSRQRSHSNNIDDNYFEYWKLVNSSQTLRL